MTEDKARELAKRFGIRMCDESGNTHGEELYCVGLDDIMEMAKALAQPEKEPVAVSELKRLADAVELRIESIADRIVIADKLRKLAYTTPPQRTWVGLTDEEVVQCQQGNIYHFYRCIEAKLREKNT